MKVFRLSKAKYCNELSGKGAALFGNRWNSKGTEMIYMANIRALAVAEVAVHLSFGHLPKNYMMLEINIPVSIKIGIVEIKKLSDGWNMNPPMIDTQEIGDRFIRENRFCILQVPSAVVKGDFNFLLNPYHKDFLKIKISEISDFPFDERIFK